MGQGRGGHGPEGDQGRAGDHRGPPEGLGHPEASEGCRESRLASPRSPLLGTNSTLFSPQSALMIAPVLANLGPLEDLTFKPNPEEVAQGSGGPL